MISPKAISIIILFLFFGLVFSCNSQTREERILKEMASFVEETINSECQNMDSSFLCFIKDFLNEDIKFRPKLNKKKLININKELHKKDSFSFFYQKFSKKEFVNSSNLPDSIFRDFKNKYTYNVVRISDEYLSYYLRNNNSASADYIKKQNEDIKELSPIYYSQFLIPRLSEIELSKNKELFAILFWPYFCYSSGIDFYPN